VEAQQDSAADRGSPKSSVIHEDPARRAARTRAQADLKDASAAAHRSMLEQAIADLDRKIAALDKP
jgi:hypothetical protein